MNGRTLVAVPYGRMVANLFKPMGSLAATALHAAVGIAGEAAELAAARRIEDVVEELGDVEFYVEAYYQTVGGRDDGVEVVVERPDPCYDLTLATAAMGVSVAAGNLLDLTKKAWVYGKPLDLQAVRYQLMRIEVMMETVRELFSVRRADVLGANQAKLGKRYPDGVYADAAAQQRADKPGTSDFD